MMRYFNFDRLIDKYSRTFTAVLPTTSSYVHGEYVEETPQKVEMQGAIINLSERKIFNSNGTLTSKDYQLYVKGKLPTNIVGAKVIFEDNEYSIDNDTNNSEFTGVTAYILKYVSAFKKETTND